MREAEEGSSSDPTTKVVFAVPLSRNPRHLVG
jgi:hypothetical protein